MNLNSNNTIEGAMHQADEATNQATEAWDFKDHTALKANNAILYKITNLISSN